MKVSYRNHSSYYQRENKEKIKKFIIHIIDILGNNKNK